MSLSVKIIAFVFGIALYGAAGLVLANAANTETASQTAIVAQ
ncbi:hypothetical protein [Coralliovum pocilloporae]